MSPLAYVLIAAAIAIGVLVWFIDRRWTLALQAERPKELGTVKDPVFGTVTQTTQGWQATVPFPPIGGDVDVTSEETSQPTDNDRARFADIVARYRSLLPELKAKFQEAGRVHNQTYGRWTLETIDLNTSSGSASFSLLFEVEGSEWGFEARYVDFELDEFGDLH